MSVNCAVAGLCGGCPWIDRPFSEQVDAKLQAFRTAWLEAGIDPAPLSDLTLETVAEAGLRDRTDLSFRRDDGLPVLGMWDLEKTRLIDVGPCPALSPPLRAWLERLQADPLPVDRASIRLRVAPDGTLGLWLDLANLDVKTLMDEGAWLRRRLAEAVVEVGQRRKPLYDDEGRLRLGKDLEMRPWFQTWIDGDRPVPLYGPVGGFSQPSFAANRRLVAQVMAIAAEIGGSRWLELGAGNGNFTLPLASTGATVTALEQDEVARAGLLRSAAECGLSDRIEVTGGDMHRGDNTMQARLEGVDAVLADPPRSGLRGFVDALAALPAEARPRHLLYVSCYQESLVGDIARLEAAGYRTRKVVGVDQFPQTPHCEWIAWLSR